MGKKDIQRCLGESRTERKRNRLDMVRGREVGEQERIVRTAGHSKR